MFEGCFIVHFTTQPSHLAHLAHRVQISVRKTVVFHIYHVIVWVSIRYPSSRMLYRILEGRHGLLTTVVDYIIRSLPVRIRPRGLFIFNVLRIVHSVITRVSDVR